MAFDTVHVLRHSQRLSRPVLRKLTALLDFGACANDVFDNSGPSRQELSANRRVLLESPIDVPVHDYWCRLRDLERGRPVISGDDQRHRSAQLYRESVVRLSLGVVAVTAWGQSSIDDGIEATHRDEDIETLFRMVMLCQIIDDVLDYSKDLRRRLPSFVTAHVSPVRALALTSTAATQYATGVGHSPRVLPFRIAVSGMSAFASVLILLGSWRQRSASWLRRAFPQSDPG